MSQRIAQSALRRIDEGVIVDGKSRSVAALLLQQHHTDEGFWPWLRCGQEPTIKEANKFLLGAILDYQIPAQQAWDNARRLSETILGDPELLWHTITSVTLDEWRSKWREYKLHKFPAAHQRVWTIGSQIVCNYHGDAREIWQDRSIDNTLTRLNKIGVGKQLSRMVAGALHDTGQVQGIGSVKADLHIRRVLARVCGHQPFAALDECGVTAETKKMHPENPWLLDRPLYELGQRTCHRNDPDCTHCYLREHCAYYAESATSICETR